MIYYLKHEGKIYKVDTERCTLLLTTRWQLGREQTRWGEVYRTPNGRYVHISRSLWQGESDDASFVPEPRVIELLAFCEPEQRTDDGEQMLRQHEADVVEEA